MPTCNIILKHISLITATVVSFWVSGHFGQLCEIKYSSLVFGTLTFLLSFAVCLLVLLKICTVVQSKLFG